MKVKLNDVYTSKLSDRSIKVIGIYGDPEDRDSVIRVGDTVDSNRRVDPATIRNIYQDSIRRRYG